MEAKHPPRAPLGTPTSNEKSDPFDTISMKMHPANAHPAISMISVLSIFILVSSKAERSIGNALQLPAVSGESRHSGMQDSRKRGGLASAKAQKGRIANV